MAWTLVHSKQRKLKNRLEIEGRDGREREEKGGPFVKGLMLHGHACGMSCVHVRPN